MDNTGNQNTMCQIVLTNPFKLTIAVSREDMEDAMQHPEKHENLIVRIGGYSEYFNRLSDELKRTVIRRTQF
jgi:pyruvate-formate lyase